MQMTEGLIKWVSLKGHNHGEYWLLKMKHFHVDLDPVSKVFTGTVAADISKPRSPRTLLNQSTRSKTWLLAPSLPACADSGNNRVQMELQEADG